MITPDFDTVNGKNQYQLRSSTMSDHDVLRRAAELAGEKYKFTAEP